MAKSPILNKGTFSFTIESRILRELGERLVKQPEVALLELIKNSYDADATECTIAYMPSHSVTITDNGNGMTLERFRHGWMRIGTSSKAASNVSERYSRLITGEKGIGRFAVRFLGRRLHLESISDDSKFRCRTRLIANFDWPKIDASEDIGKVKVPYSVERVDKDVPTGTILTVTRLRSEVDRLDLKAVRTGSLGVLTPLRSLFPKRGDDDADDFGAAATDDPGFVLKIQQEGLEEENDVAGVVLSNFVLRARLRVKDGRARLSVYKRGDERPYIRINDKFPNHLGGVYADIRFFPRRSGTFTKMPVNGKVAEKWVKDNSGVSVFDRNFRVRPYGTSSDDWLQLQADAARNRRDPRSSLAQKHFPMSAEVKASPSENWMLRLPESAQLVGLVQVDARRSAAQRKSEYGLVASADREGFVENDAFLELRDIVRGAVESIAYADRKIQQERERAEHRALIARVRKETRDAIEEIETNPDISSGDKAKIVAALAQTQELAEQHEEATQEREHQLEVMSLLGVVAGFMTHEFGAALQTLEKAHKELLIVVKSYPKLTSLVSSFEEHIQALKDFVKYSSGYIQGAKTLPSRPYPAKPRLLQVKRTFGKYADDRSINIEITAENDLLAPLVPAALYNGLALNLYTNALKAVTAKVGNDAGKIAFRAWNDERWHYLEVSDTGIGIPVALRDRVFDPLFTTTGSSNDPLGSGMGLGLALVRRSAEAFGGKAEVVEPPPGFSTCVRIKLPIEGD